MRLSYLVRIASLDSAAITPAVRLAAYLAVKECVLEHQAPKAAQVTPRAWDKIRPALTSAFSFSAGKITLPPDCDLDEFDLLFLRTELNLDPAKKKQARYPTDPRILDMIDLGIPPADASKLAMFIIRNYGESHLSKAIKAAQEKVPPPLEPANFIRAVVKGNANAVATGGLVIAGMRARRVKRFVKITNPESARTELIGWEAPCSTEGAVARYTRGNRRLVYRMRNGQLQFVEPKADQHVPNAEQDPGVVIED